MTVSLIHKSPHGDNLIAYLARVSNSSATPDMSSKRLIEYLIRNKHWSPFEMASMCVEINTSRDIGRQILRHRSFSFQEFSQRYAEVVGDPVFKEARLQDQANRQSSQETNNQALQSTWENAQKAIWDKALKLYQEFLTLGVAKEVARTVLPEGLTPTKMYMHGTVRSWIHYLQERTASGVQKEHRLIAEAIKAIFSQEFPATALAVFGEQDG